MSSAPIRPRPGAWTAAALVAGVLAFGLLAADWGVSTHWDSRNYHLYNAWALLQDRHDLDVAPGQLQTWFNPALQVPFYLSAAHWPAPFHLFLLGILQGLNGLLLYRLARRLLPQALQGDGRAMALGTALAGITSATVLGQLGTTVGDNLVSLGALGALLVALRPGGPTSAQAGLGGLLLGVGTALKLTLAPVAVGLSLAIVLCAPRKAWPRLVVMVGLGAMAGFAALGGWWMWRLWEQFGNPLYPQFGSVFPGAWEPPFPVRDTRFLPAPAWRAWQWPLAPLLDWRLVSDIRFRDLRVPALALGALLLPWWRAPRAEDAARGAGNALLAGLALAYATWLFLFGYHRYLAVVEMLAPLALLMLLARAWPQSRHLRTLAAVLLALLVVTTDPPNWGNAPRAWRVLDLTLPREVPVRGALVLMASEAPIGFLAPAWPEPARFVRVQSNFHGETWPPHALDHRVARAIDAHAGPLVVVHASDNAELLEQGLARFGIARDAAACGRIEAAMWPADELPLQLCPATRVEPAAVALERVYVRWRAACANAELLHPAGRKICAAVGG